MPLSPGDRLGPYEILAPIGKGGMGEVYKARDTRLDRIVALKVSDAQFSERFEREAKAIGALSHPNICTLHDVGPNYLVMEYIEGAPLKGPLPLDQALKYAVQICDALDTAHKKGITHRDLKPANILATKAGIKLLDFGLAKLSSASQAPKPNDATLTMALTGKNEIVGTLYYMSPEQLQAQATGQEIDARSDIFSFGLVLYGILTGKRAFEGSSPASVIAAIMERPAPSIASIAPPALDRLLQRCLAKDPDDRWQSARDLKAELEWIAGASGEAIASAPEAARQSATRVRVLSTITALAVIAATVLAFLYFRTSPPAEESVAKFSVLPPPNVSLTSEYAPIISPDGKKLAFIARDASGKNMVWVRRIDSLTAQPLVGTEDARNPFWAPDSSSIAFLYQTKLQRVDLTGGAPRTLCEAPLADAGGTWSSEGVILLGSLGLGPLLRVPSGGGACQAATDLNRERQERAHVLPQFLPDGRHFLYLARSTKQGNTAVMVGSLDSKETKLLFPSYSQAVYAAPGFLLFLRDKSLMAQRFDVGRLEFSSDAFAVAEQIVVNLFGDLMVSASANGVLVFRSGTSGNSQLTWFDRSGKSLGSVGPPGDYVNVALSADGKRVAFQRQGSLGDRDIWQMEIDRPVPQRVTFSPSDDTNPLWSPDGSTIVFASNREGRSQLFQKPSSGVGSEELLVKTDGDSIPTEFSADGRFLIFRMVNKQGFNEGWVLPMSGERKPFGYLQGNDFHQNIPRLSPNGRWLAYYTNDQTVFLQSFPKPGGKWQVSTAGGFNQHWSRDGKELFYVAPSGELMAVTVKGETAPEIGTPVTLFTPRILGGARTIQGYRSQYDIAPDGRFLIIVPADEGAGSSMTVVTNWTAGLKK